MSLIGYEPCSTQVTLPLILLRDQRIETRMARVLLLELREDNQFRSRVTRDVLEAMRRDGVLTMDSVNLAISSALSVHDDAIPHPINQEFSPALN